LRGSGATLLTAVGYDRVYGANERVGVGFIAFGLIGKRHVLDFKEQPDVEPVAVAEVHPGRLDEANRTRLASEAARGARARPGER
jgi:hypothetical protein